MRDIKFILTLTGSLGHKATGRTVPRVWPVFLPREDMFKLTLRVWERSISTLVPPMGFILKISIVKPRKFKNEIGKFITVSLKVEIWSLGIFSLARK